MYSSYRQSGFTIQKYKYSDQLLMFRREQKQGLRWDYNPGPGHYRMRSDLNGVCMTRMQTWRNEMHPKCEKMMED